MADASAPGEQDLTVYQGQDWVAVFELYQDTANTIPFDLTGYEIDMHVREGVADSAASLKIAASTRSTGDGAGRIEIIGRQSSGEVDVNGGEIPTDGVFKVTLAADVTSAVSPTKAPRKGDLATAEFVYDIELTSDTGIVTRILKGTLTLDLEVTRRA